MSNEDLVKTFVANHTTTTTETGPPHKVGDIPPLVQHVLDAVRHLIGKLSPDEEAALVLKLVTSIVNDWRLPDAEKKQVLDAVTELVPALITVLQEVAAGQHSQAIECLSKTLQYVSDAYYYLSCKCCRAKTA
jgi:hypothetical protein